MRRIHPSAGQRHSISQEVPPPVGGWNQRDSESAMDPRDATRLDNLFPSETEVVVRKGYSEHCDLEETGAFVETLVEFHTGTTRKLLAACNGKIQDVSTSTPSSLGTGFSENRWITAVFNKRAFFVNGVDAPQDFDGSTLSATSWTGSGLTITDLSYVIAYKARLYFVEQETQSFWYGGQNAITGTLTEFDLSRLGNFGGNLIAIQSLTQDGGDGVDDLLAFFMSSGEVLIYQGDNPEASNWALVGTFRIGSVIDPRTVVKYGSDCLAVTQDGYIALTDFLPFGRSARTLSDKIVRAAREVIQLHGSREGWQIIHYPRGDMLLFNVPRSATKFDQHVMNSRTGAWCRFKELDGKCWALFNDRLYFGGANGVIYLADEGKTDNGAEIIGDGQQAWNYFGMRGSYKRFTMVRPIIKSISSPLLQVGLATDFDLQNLTAAVNFSTSGNISIWDQAIWDQSVWTTDTARTDFVSVDGTGYCAALRCRIVSTQDQPRWNATLYVFEPGTGF